MLLKKAQLKTILLCSFLALNGCNNQNESSPEDSKNGGVVELKSSTGSYTSLSTSNKLLLIGGNGGLHLANSNTENRTSGFKVPTFQSKETQNRSSNSDDVKIYTLAEQSDGKIIIAGNFGYINGKKANSMIRINQDGSVDDTFMPKKDGFNGEVYHIEILDDNTILVGGYFNKLDDEDISQGLVKLNIDGTVNTVYSELNIYDRAVVNDFVVLNNKIFLTGSFISENNGEYSERALLAINSTNNLDDTFNKKVNSILGTGYKILKKDNNLIVAGAFENSLSNILKLNLNGDIDSSFHLNELQGFIFDIEYKDDTLMVAGDFIFDEDGVIKRGLAIFKNNKLVKISNLDIEADIYDINTFEDKVILVGEGNYRINNKNYVNSIMLDREVIQ